MTIKEIILKVKYRLYDLNSSNNLSSAEQQELEDMEWFLDMLNSL